MAAASCLTKGRLRKYRGDRRQAGGQHEHLEAYPDSPAVNGIMNYLVEIDIDIPGILPYRTVALQPRKRRIA